MKEVIEVKNLSRYYGEGALQVKALNNVSLKVNRGEFAAIVGPSGSGKSTLLQLIGGLDVPTRGEVELAEIPVSKMSGQELSDFRRDHIGFIFQSYNLIPVLSAEENVEFVMLLQGVPEEERHLRSRAALKAVGLGGYENRRPAQLSGGQQQRVAVARALAAKPDIILADEPTANLDSHAGSSLLDMMRELNEKEGVTFLFSTHDNLIMERAKRIIRLRDGKIEGDEIK